MFKIETFTGKRGGWFPGNLRWNDAAAAKRYADDTAARERQMDGTAMSRRVVPA